VSARPVPPQHLWKLAAGFGVWGSALGALYALHSIGCAFAWPAGPLRLGLAAVLFAHLTVIGLMWHSFAGAEPDRAVDQTGSFLHSIAVWTVVAAFVATGLTLGPPLLLTACT